MLDFHSHVLPAMDDGSRDVETSLAMLAASGRAGVTTICATSHFYAWDNSPKEFLARRAAALGRLQAGMEREPNAAYPAILPGAEVRYFGGMSQTDGLETLCLEGTNLLLLEMPFTAWSAQMLHEVSLLCRRGIQPVAAHIERYMPLQSRRTMRAFMEMNILIQCNAEFFLDRRTARKALRMLEAGSIHFLGSDAHNMTNRAPNMGEAVEIIRQKSGERVLQYLQKCEIIALDNFQD